MDPLRALHATACEPRTFHVASRREVKVEEREIQVVLSAPLPPVRRSSCLGERAFTLMCAGGPTVNRSLPHRCRHMFFSPFRFLRNSPPSATAGYRPLESPPDWTPDPALQLRQARFY